MFFRKKVFSLIDIADETVISAGKDTNWVFNIENLSAPKQKLDAMGVNEKRPIWSEFLKAYVGMTITAYASKFPDKSQEFADSFTVKLKERLDIATGNDVSWYLSKEMEKNHWYDEVNKYIDMNVLGISRTLTKKIYNNAPFKLTEVVKKQLAENIKLKVYEMQQHLETRNFKELD